MLLSVFIASVHSWDPKARKLWHLSHGETVSTCHSVISSGMTTVHADKNLQ